VAAAAAAAVVSELAVQAEVLADSEAHKQVEAAHTRTTILEVALASKAPLLVPAATKIVDATANAGAVLAVASPADVAADIEAQTHVEPVAAQNTVLEIALGKKAPGVPVASEIADAGVAPTKLPDTSLVKQTKVKLAKHAKADRAPQKIKAKTPISPAKKKSKLSTPNLIPTFSSNQKNHPGKVCSFDFLEEVKGIFVIMA
jgi:hypothetical protein